MDILPIRVPEYAGKSYARHIPESYAVEKSEYVKDRKETIKKIDCEISSLKKTLSEISDTESYYYQDAVKRLKKCYEIKQNCEASIVLTRNQMKIEKKPRVR